MSDVIGKPRRVLMLVSGFPPARQSILRTVKFAKYLPEYGWGPVVITPAAEAAGRPEAPLLAEPRVFVRRTPRLPTLSTLVAALPRRSGIQRVEESSTTSRAGRRLALSRVNAAIRGALAWGDTPDAFAGWIPFAVATGWRLARSCRAAAIHASGPPFSVVCAGAILSRLTGLPLVADFRDAWTLDPSDPFGTLAGWFSAQLTARRVRCLRALERWVLTSSTAVLFTSRATRTLYLDEYPEIEKKSSIIYNGADPDDFTNELRLPDRPTLAHVGTLHDYQREQVEVFLRGFARALRTRTVPPDTQLTLAGAIGLKLRVNLEAAANDLGIASAVKIVGFVPHAQAVGWMRASRLLLLFAGENRYVRLSKISEYVAAGPPMLAFAPRKSETAEEVQLYGGRVLSHVSEPELEAELALAFEAHNDVRRGPHAIEHPHPLNRRTEAQYLADILARAVDR